jgi:hypothetical protein
MGFVEFVLRRGFCSVKGLSGADTMNISPISMNDEIKRVDRQFLQIIERVNPRSVFKL